MRLPHYALFHRVWRDCDPTRIACWTVDHVGHEGIILYPKHYAVEIHGAVATTLRKDTELSAIFAGHRTRPLTERGPTMPAEAAERKGYYFAASGIQHNTTYTL